MTMNTSVFLSKSPGLSFLRHFLQSKNTDDFNQIQQTGNGGECLSDFNVFRYVSWWLILISVRKHNNSAAYLLVRTDPNF
jgi:hypothetical protein